MKFNLAYFGPEHGPEPLFHLRRDFLLATKHGLEGLGHDVILSGLQLDTTRFNLVVGAYFLAPLALRSVVESGVRLAKVKN